MAGHIKEIDELLEDGEFNKQKYKMIKEIVKKLSESINFNK